MAGSERCFLFLTLAGFLSLVSGAANLDAREPIVKLSPGDREIDRFGYAVLLHQITTPVPGSFESYLNNTRLVIGAPNGMYPGGLPLPAEPAAVRNTGLVYECPVGQGDCRRPADRESFLFDSTANAELENKTGQLMGSVLFSKGNYFVACAPLYVVLTPPNDAVDNSRPVGRCFASERDLQEFQTLRPCRGNERDNAISTVNVTQQCLAGFSAAILDPDSSPGIVVLGAPGSLSFVGNLYSYDVNSSSASLVNQTRNFDADRRVRYQYEGFSTTTGDITAIDSQDLIAGVPRMNGTVLFGGVTVRRRNDLGGSPEITLSGSQTGEYYGGAVAAADLNGDGYDELIVGAPIYSTRTRQEGGRVYIYRNMGGTIDDAAVILEGSSVQSRFGSSIVNLGDINGDNLEDIAIGAPYEGIFESDRLNTGRVYIYYGSNSSDSIISSTADQVLKAEDVVESVSQLSSLNGFGFSLSSGVDVDGNDYNDLLVGAQVSGAAVLFRSLSIANIEIVNITSSSQTILLDTVGTSGTPFSVRVCARYNGRGLNTRPLTVNIRVEEVMNGPSRIYFNSSTPNINYIVAPFSFDTTDIPSCEDVRVYGKALANLTQLFNFLSPIELQVSFFSVDRPVPTYINGTPEQLVDYRDFPLVLFRGNNTVSVLPSVNCSGRDEGEEACISDLIVIFNETVFLTSNRTVIESGRAVAGLVQTVEVKLMYENIGSDPALGSELLFTLPNGFFFISATTPTEELSCQEDNTRSSLYTCLLPNFIPPQDRRTDANAQLTLLWRVDGKIVGNEEPQTSNISIRLAPSEGSNDRESNTTNNDLINGPVTIAYEAIADLDVSSFMFTLTVANYRRTTVVSNPTLSQIGRTVQLQFRAVNRGPSNAPTTRVEVYVPTNDSVNQFYLYLTNATAVFTGGSRIADCDFGGINPQNLRTTSSNRRKRSVQKRQEQASSEPVTSLPDVIRNCSDPALRANRTCTAITCNIPDLMISPGVEISITAALDDRFFATARAPYTFVAYGRVYSNASFVVDPDPSNNQNMTQGYRVTMFIPPERVAFPFWIIIVIGVVFVIFLIILFIILYCCGCFRRKRPKDDLEGEEATSTVKVTAIKPENGLGEEKVPTDSPESVKKADYDASDEIGDASDLQADDEPEKPPKDSDETSL